MLAEVLATLQPVDHEIYVDGTFGAGGYTRAILEKAQCTVIAIDRDRDAAARAQPLKEKYGARFIFLHGCFGDVADLLKSAGFEKVHGFVLDLGVSSMQLDEAHRGFSFRASGPLDMRMDNAQGRTAADIVNRSGEKELADLIYLYGEERHSRRIAKKIVETRAIKPFATTEELAATIRAVMPRTRKDEIDPATRTFQALRIAVNDELGELERALAAAEHILLPGGRVVIVSFHSLEDGAVKKFLRHKSGGDPEGSRHLPQTKIPPPPVFSLLTKKALKPSDEETRTNARARSARLRAAARTEAA
jgi:16S rRNA (cytosine1402-N4)-methyltransferase